jgi:chromosome segregation ATPase
MSADKLEEGVSDLEQHFKMLVEMVRRHDTKNTELSTRNAELSQSFVTVVKLLQRHDQRLDEAREAQPDTDRRIAALVDAQIRTEEAGRHADERIAALAVAQNRTDEAISRLTARLDHLTETVDRYIEGRNGQGLEAIDE